MDGVALAVEILKESLDIPVGTDMPRDNDMPKGRPRRYVLVGLEADDSTPYLLRPRIALTCWGTTDRDAHRIAISAVEALQDAADDHPYLFDADLETMSREEWARNGHGRYLAVVNLTINTDE